jgi:isochorismate synthase EntC
MGESLMRTRIFSLKKSSHWFVVRKINNFIGESPERLYLKLLTKLMSSILGQFNRQAPPDVIPLLSVIFLPKPIPECNY